jgi:hypothetical protein
MMTLLTIAAIAFATPPADASMDRGIGATIASAAHNPKPAGHQQALDPTMMKQGSPKDHVREDATAGPAEADRVVGR